jgi:hypothetical protein
MAMGVTCISKYSDFKFVVFIMDTPDARVTILLHILKDTSSKHLTTKNMIAKMSKLKMAAVKPDIDVYCEVFSQVQGWGRDRRNFYVTECFGQTFCSVQYRS